MKQMDLFEKTYRVKIVSIIDVVATTKEEAECLAWEEYCKPVDTSETTAAIMTSIKELDQL